MTPDERARRHEPGERRYPSVAIVGGGIAGMALALSLHDAGLTDVDVYESASSIRELGVGINLLPHATRELTELGLLDDLYGTGLPTAELVFYSKHGQRIWREPRGIAAGYHWPQFSIHRSELLGVLHRAVRTRLGPERIHVGHHLARFGPSADRVWAEFVDRTSGEPRGRVTADVLVGCDGIHCAVRRAMVPNEVPPRWNGITMWRGVTEGPPFLTGRTMIEVGHPACQLVAYPISRRHEIAGTALINWVIGVKNDADQPMPPQDWEYTARPEDVLQAFEPFALDFLDVSALIGGAQTVYRYPMVDRDPLPSWDFGHVTLLGDAAHPMYPVGSNGASQAIIDARVLARELALRPSVEQAIAAYDAVRRPETADVVHANRKWGPERCLQIVEERAPNGFADLDEVISRAELEEISTTYRRVAGFDPALLNNRPSLAVGRPAARQDGVDRVDRVAVAPGGGKLTRRGAVRRLAFHGLFAAGASALLAAYARAAQPAAAPAPRSPGHVLVLGPGEGRVIPGPEGLTLKASGEQTYGSIGLLEATTQPGFGPPPHIHYDNDELFYILAGEFQFLIGERRISASAGSFVFVPRGTVHAPTVVGPEPGKAIIAFVPGGQERAFDEFAALAAATGGNLDLADERARAIARKYNSEIVAPSG